MKNVLFILFIFTIILFSCRREDQISTDASHKLSFSIDTLLFDTVFSTIGSSTRNFKIYNPNSNKIVISSIKLGGGNNSFFRLNINGVPKTEFSNIEIRPKDSIWVFAEVTINPQKTNLPFIVKDSLICSTNGNIQDVKLVAFGQNAIFHRPDPGKNTFLLPKNDVWKNDTPHVVYGVAIIDENSSLTIEKGTKVHFHPGSGLVAYKGATLKVNGTKDEPVYMEGDRLEPWYEETPGQWGGIYLYPLSVASTIDYAVIKNAQVGIQVDTVDLNNGNPTLTIKNTKIRNCSETGILGRGTWIKAYNCAVYNCGSYCGAFIMGGDYEIAHCTFSNNWSFYSKSRETPSVVVNNWYKDGNGTVIGRNLNSANFINCIIYGNREHELSVSKKDGFTFNYAFKNSLIRADKSELDYTAIEFSNCIINQNPKLKSSTDLHLGASSPAQNSGDLNYVNSNLSVLGNDLDGISRTVDAKPDLGCFEYAP